MCSELAHCEAVQRQAREWDGAAVARLEAQLVRLVEVCRCLVMEFRKLHIMGSASPRSNMWASGGPAAEALRMCRTFAWWRHATDWFIEVREAWE